MCEIAVFAGVGSMSGNTSTQDTTAGSVTSSAVSDHVSAPAEDKRLLEPAVLEERRSMQPIGTERMNKKPRTTGGLVATTQGFPFMPPTNVMPPWAASSMRECSFL